MSKCVDRTVSADAMTPALRNRCESIREVLAMVGPKDARLRYRIGLLVRKAQARPSIYGKRAVEQVGRCLGYGSKTLYHYAAVADGWAPKELNSVLAQRGTSNLPLRWSHIALLAPIAPTRRDALIQAVLEKNPLKVRLCRNLEIALWGAWKVPAEEALVRVDGAGVPGGGSQGYGVVNAADADFGACPREAGELAFDGATPVRLASAAAEPRCDGNHVVVRVHAVREDARIVEPKAARSSVLELPAEAINRWPTGDALEGGCRNGLRDFAGSQGSVRIVHAVDQEHSAVVAHAQDRGC